jgi:uncharacterized membrane protein YcaP (DUF421 family)
MKEKDYHFGDLARTFIGQYSGAFFVEILIRTVILYLLLLVCMRLMGSRMSAQLSRNESLGLVSLAAAIGIPLQVADKGILPAFIVALTVVFVNRRISAMVTRREKLESFLVGDYNILVENNVMQTSAMEYARISTDRLLAQLRSEGVRHLGEVKRLYIEANGAFNLIRMPDPVPGLSVLPVWDQTFREENKVTDIVVCNACGKRQEEKDCHDGHCTHCHNNDWVKAVE